MAFTLKKLIKVMAALILILPVGNAIAAPCDIKNSALPFIIEGKQTGAAERHYGMRGVLYE